MPSRGFAAVLVLAAALAPAARVEVAAGAPSGAGHDMKSHFVQVGVLHEAVIRGDLPAARAAAAMLARSEIALGERSTVHREAMKTLAQRVEHATDVASAAAATGSMLGACGECHRTSGAVVTPVLPERPVVGEAVGHMLDHQRAVDRLMQGLVVPSSSMWSQGAQALRVAPLNPGKLPRDPRLTSEIAASEKRLHAIADRAAAAEPNARADVYGQLIATCAACHSVHSTIWGPGKRQ